MKFGHYYDLTKVMDTDLINSIDHSTLSYTELSERYVKQFSFNKYFNMIHVINFEMLMGRF